MPIITELKEKGNASGSLTRSPVSGPVERGKMPLARVPDGVLTILIVVLASTGSFGLGYLSGKESGGEGVVIQEPFVSEANKGQATGEVAGNTFVSLPVTSVKKSAPKTIEPQTVTSGGQYVASKNGTKYHFPWCPGAKAMNEENKIYFNSKEAAEAAGFTPAANCKGL